MIFVLALMLVLAALAGLGFWLSQRKGRPEATHSRPAFGWWLLWSFGGILTLWSLLFFVALVIPDPEIQDASAGPSSFDWLTPALFSILIFAVPVVLSLVFMFKRRFKTGVALSALPIALFVLLVYGFGALPGVYPP